MAFARLNEASIEPERLTWEELSLLALSNTGGEAIRFRIRSMIAVCVSLPHPKTCHSTFAISPSIISRVA